MKSENWKIPIVIAVAVFLLMPVSAFGGETADLSFVNAPAKAAYLEVGGVWGLDVVFEPLLKQNFVTMEMSDVSATEALRRLALAMKHHIAVTETGAIVVMMDTPQNHREYEALEIQTFVPSYIRAVEFDKMLRSLIEARRLSADSELGTVSVRDTQAKICIARRILDRVDKAPAEIDLVIRVVESDSALLEAGATRLSTGELNEFLGSRETTTLAVTGLTLVGAAPSHLTTRAPGGFGGELKLEALGKHHRGSNEVTLDFSFAWNRLPAAPDREGRSVVHSTKQAARLAIGETVVLGLPSTPEKGGRAVMITPKLVRPSDLENDSFDPIWVGTESSILGDCDPVIRVTEGARIQRAPRPVEGPAYPVRAP